MAKRGNGEGSISYLESKNLWVAKCFIKDKRKYFYGKTRKEANQKMLDAKAEELTGNYVDKSEITLGQLSTEIIEDKFKSNAITENSYRRLIYTNRIINDSDISDMNIQDIKAKDIKEFLLSITNYSNETISKVYSLLGQTFRRAIERDIIVKNPMLFEETKKPKSVKKDTDVISLSIDEQKRLVNALSQEVSPYVNAIFLMLFTGMRIGEVLALKVDDFDENYIHINATISKNKNDKYILGDTTKTKNSVRDISITENIKRILERAKKDYVENENRLLFYDSKDNSIITPSEVNSYINRLNKRYQIAPHIHNHMLRHTYATRCIEAGMNVKVLSKKLGHKNIETTLNTYASVLEKFEISEDEKLDKFFTENDLNFNF